MTVKDLTEMESFALDEKTAGETSQEEEQDSYPVCSNQPKPNLGVTILASRFAANTRRGVQKTKLQKPEEPDFSAEQDD